MSLTCKLKIIFSVLCFFFKPASWHLLLYQYRSIHFDTHISKQHSPIKSRVHVPLLYLEHLPLQRSLHGPAPVITSINLDESICTGNYPFNKTIKVI